MSRLLLLCLDWLSKFGQIRVQGLVSLSQTCLKKLINSMHSMCFIRGACFRDTLERYHINIVNIFKAFRGINNGKSHGKTHPVR